MLLRPLSSPLERFSPGFFDQQPEIERLRYGKPQKPYRQKSLVTKQRIRLTRLRTRILRKTSLFFFTQYQQKLAENPEYYSVCIIAEQLLTIHDKAQLRRSYERLT